MLFQHVILGEYLQVLYKVQRRDPVTCGGESFIFVLRETNLPVQSCSNDPLDPRHGQGSFESGDLLGSGRSALEWYDKRERVWRSVLYQYSIPLSTLIQSRLRVR